MRIKLFIMCYLFADFRLSFAWLPPERCAQTFQSILTAAVPKTARIVTSIKEIVAGRHDFLKETYKDHQFQGVPVRATCSHDQAVFIHAPYNCSFLTYSPRVLSSVVCHNVACKLTHTVATVDTYTSSEGYNWGVKISSKASFFEKTFEVGGEVSTGGTYTCTYAKGKTSTDAVECSSSNNKGQLQLYYLKSDVECVFGNVYLDEDQRDGKHSVSSRVNYFTKDELDEIYKSAAAVFEPCSEIMIDPDKISDRLLQKMLRDIPHYNPYTDAVEVSYSDIKVYYLKRTRAIEDYRKVIPFTNEGGDSEFQYACLFSPF